MRRALPLLGGFAVLAAVLAWAQLRTPPPDEVRVLAHYAEYPRLVRSAWTGDRSLGSVVARDLTAGPEGERGGEATLDAQARVGGALGFVGFAENSDELTAAVATAAAGCGACHQSLEVVAPPRPPWSHERAAEWLSWGLVWADGGAPGGGPAPLDAVGAAYQQEVASDTGDLHGDQAVRVARAWAVCVACHESQTELPSAL